MAASLQMLNSKKKMRSKLAKEAGLIQSKNLTEYTQTTSRVGF
jgi:hypothetical protein